MPRTWTTRARTSPPRPAPMIVTGLVIALLLRNDWTAFYISSRIRREEQIVAEKLNPCYILPTDGIDSAALRDRQPRGRCETSERNLEREWETEKIFLFG